jgi:hypothetical protein
MLGGRKITAMLVAETLEGAVAKGYPQGGILSHLLCSLVVEVSLRDSKGMTLIHQGIHYHH